MKILIYIGLYLFIIGTAMFWMVINAVEVDDEYNVIGESKLKQWVKKVKSSVQQIGKGEVKNK